MVPRPIKLLNLQKENGSKKSHKKPMKKTPSNQREDKYSPLKSSSVKTLSHVSFMSKKNLASSLGILNFFIVRN